MRARVLSIYRLTIRNPLPRMSAGTDAQTLDGQYGAIAANEALGEAGDAASENRKCVLQIHGSKLP